jgi:hypothetical protein
MTWFVILDAAPASAPGSGMLIGQVRNFAGGRA